MKSSHKFSLFALVLTLAVSTGCARRQAMYDQPKYEPFEKSDFFGDGQANRMPVPGTLARGDVSTNPHLTEGKVNGNIAATYPFEVTRDILNRGQARFQIYCTPCHNQNGDGLGMVVKRGFMQPPSLHIDRLRKAPVGHFFNVITNGIGNMSAYNVQIPPEDRWAITAYVRALQFSQNARESDVPAPMRAKLEETAK